MDRHGHQILTLFSSVKFKECTEKFEYQIDNIVFKKNVLELKKKISIYEPYYDFYASEEDWHVFKKWCKEIKVFLVFMAKIGPY